MIVAYPNKQVVYAYKGVFNRNIDYDWTGAILMVHAKIIDLCRVKNNVHPNPVNVWVPGIAFNKEIPLLLIVILMVMQPLKVPLLIPLIIIGMIVAFHHLFQATYIKLK